jgi:hypothetical protein
MHIGSPDSLHHVVSSQNDLADNVNIRGKGRETDLIIRSRVNVVDYIMGVSTFETDYQVLGGYHSPSTI